MDHSFEQFIKERQYLSNVSPRTIQWYKAAFAWLPSASPSEEQLKDLVIRMRERGLKPTGCNCHARAINAYLKWAGSPLRIAKMKEPSLILPVFSLPQIKKLIAWKPRGFYQRRLHLIVLILLDTGCRIGEVLSLRVENVDLNDLLMAVTGKGDRQRRIPISFELRKHLFRYLSSFPRQPHDLLIATRRSTSLDRHVVSRDVKLLCQRLGFDPPVRTLHSFRHSFSVNYLRKGGSVFHLQKVLGHSSLEMTKKYCNLMTEDLSQAHQKCSLLGAL